MDSVNVSDRLSGDHSQRRAREGTTFIALSYFTSVVNSTYRCTCRARGWSVSSGLMLWRSAPEANITVSALRSATGPQPHAASASRTMAR